MSKCILNLIILENSLWVLFFITKKFKEEVKMVVILNPKTSEEEVER